MEMMRNPSYQREMMRNQDRALSHIEMLPEGFNALRRTYSTIQKPMLDALDESTAVRQTATARRGSPSHARGVRITEGGRGKGKDRQVGLANEQAE